MPKVWCDAIHPTHSWDLCVAYAEVTKVHEKSACNWDLVLFMLLLPKVLEFVIL